MRLARCPRFFGCAFLALIWAAPLTCHGKGPWVTLQGGTYLVKRPNDGDSFHVSVAGKEYIFRLYFVDAPETDTEFRDRVEEQAQYFGVSVDDVVKVGELAKNYTREKLIQPFIVRTCWEDAMGRSRLPRYFAFVQTNNGDLGEQLVENGLARIHESATKPEGLASAKVEWRKLQTLEKKARAEKVGGWGVSTGRMEARAAKPESGKGVDPLEGFFRPREPAPTVEEAETGTAAAGSSVPAGQPQTKAAPSAIAVPNAQTDIIATKLDVNTASLAELENVKGVGPVMAQRIIDARPFKSADELRNVKGIGSKKYEQIRPFFQ